MSLVSFADVIRAAIPDADEAMCDYILWDRTPFPFKQLTARELYKTAASFHRGQRAGITFCDLCPRPAVVHLSYLCIPCHRALQASRQTIASDLSKQEQL